MNVYHGPAVLLALLVPALAACGGDAADGTGSASAARPVAAGGHPASSVVDWDAKVGGHELMSLKRIGNFMGTSDLVKYGSDGSVVIVKLYGGGGSGVHRCRLHAGELAKLRSDLRQMPLDPAPHVRERPRPTFYTSPSPQYILTEGKDIETFTQDAMPRDARPLVRRLRLTLDGSVATCHTVFRSRRA
jgi:hypothetical protein